MHTSFPSSIDSDPLVGILQVAARSFANALRASCCVPNHCYTSSEMPSNVNIRDLPPGTRTTQVSPTARRTIMTFSAYNAEKQSKDQLQAPETPSEERQSEQDRTTRKGKARTLFPHKKPQSEELPRNATKIVHVQLALKYVDSETSNTDPRRAGFYQNIKKEICKKPSVKTKQFKIGGQSFSFKFGLS